MAHAARVFGKGRLTVAGALIGAFLAFAPAPARATCVPTCLASGAILSIGVGSIVDYMSSMLTDYFSSMINGIFQSTNEESSRAVSTGVNQINTTNTYLTDTQNSGQFARSVATGAAGDVDVNYEPSPSACVAAMNRLETQQAEDRALAQRAQLATDSINYLATRRDPLTANGPISTAAGQFNRIASSFYDVGAWGACPAGMTCNELPASTTGTLGGFNLDPSNAVLNLQTVNRGSNEERAVKLWVDLVTQPVPEAVVDGEILATPAGRAALRQRRSDILAVNLQRYVVNDSITRRTNGAAGEPSLEAQTYKLLADPAALRQRAALRAQGSLQANIRTLGAEVDNLNYAYWQIYEHLEKIALLKAIELKKVLDTSEGADGGTALMPAVQRGP